MVNGYIIIIIYFFVSIFYL